jgi:hypothetical protein
LITRKQKGSDGGGDNDEEEPKDDFTLSRLLLARGESNETKNVRERENK